MIAVVGEKTFIGQEIIANWWRRHVRGNKNSRVVAVQTITIKMGVDIPHSKPAIGEAFGV